MTISTTTLRNSYSGNGSTTAFAYTYPINTTSEITVIERSALGVETVKAEGTGSANYGIADNGAAGGTITMVTAPAAGTTLIILRNTSLTQETDYVANDPFPAETHEDALDKLQMQTQELQEELDRSIKISRTNTMTSTEFTVDATNRASKLLAFDSSGELSITQEIGTFKGSSATTTTAAFVQRDIVKGTTTAQLNNIYICIADSAIGDTLTDTDHFALLVDAVSAAASATAAETAEANAETAQAAAETAQTAAETAETNAETAETNAGNSATAAASSATAAAASADAFDDIYLGAKSSAPSVDNDGDALTTGDQYFNTSANQLNIWNGSAWQIAAISASGLATIVGTETLTNKTLTSPKINEDVVLTSTATELNLLDGKAATNLALVGKTAGTNFTGSLLVGHATTGTLNNADRNTAVGLGSLDALTAGDDNVALGHNAGTKMTSSQYCAAVGSDALFNNVSGSHNSALGYQALYNNTGHYNLGIGRFAGRNITSGDGNVMIGEVDAGSATGDRQLKIAGYDGSTRTTWISGDSSGNVTVAGTLTSDTGLVKTVGKESIWVPSNAMTPTTTNGAARATVETTATRPDMQVLDFDKDADEYAQFTVAFPKSWNLGTVTFQAFWSGIAATTDVDWGVQAVAMNDNETIDVAFGTAVVVTDNVQGAVEELLVSAESGAITIAGTPADNDLTYFQIYRDVSGDAMAGDARLHGVKIFYTTDAANDA